MAKKIEFDLFSLKDLEELKGKIETLIKEKKAEAKALELVNAEENAKYAKNTLKIRDKIIFKYNELPQEGVVQRLNAKTFTVAFSINGEDKVLVRTYHLFIKFSSEQGKAA